MAIFNSYVKSPEGIIYIYMVGGIPNPLKNMKVSWDDDIPKRWKNKINVPNHQPVYIIYLVQFEWFQAQFLGIYRYILVEVTMGCTTALAVVP